MLAALAGIAAVRALVCLVAAILQIAGVRSAAFSWVQGAVFNRGLLALGVIVVIGLLAPLDSRGNSGGLRMAALATAIAAFVWGWALRLLPDSMRPEGPFFSFLLYSVVSLVAAIVFAHWIAALLSAAKRPPMITLATWWNSLVMVMVALAPALYVADFVADIVLFTVVAIDVWRVRQSL